MDLTKEKKLFEVMTKMYCRGQHYRNSSTLCATCKEMMDYAKERIDACPHGGNKPFCSKCTIHCFRPEYRSQVKAMMRYSGPRMILHAPKVAIQHLFATRKEKNHE